MKFLLSIIVTLFTITTFAHDGPNPEDLNTVEDVKAEILLLAESFKGQADPDFKIQNSLMPFVDRLLELAPQEPIENRLDKLVGAWKQVWGPYEYRKNDRSVDPTTDPEAIYQVVFPDGYYYNVGNSLDKKTKEVKSITLLRGEYDFKGGSDLKVKFTKLTKVKKLPENLTFIDLPELSESKTLMNEKKSLPNWLVKLTFSGGILSELYTDDDLRIAVGNSVDRNGVQKYLYVMERASN